MSEIDVLADELWRITRERDAAIARAEMAEAVDRDWQALRRDLELNASYAVEAIQKEQRERARAEAAEALAASRPEITPEMADVLMSVVDDAECEYALVKSSSSKTIGAVTSALSALRAHAAKVSR